MHYTKLCFLRRRNEVLLSNAYILVLNINFDNCFITTQQIYCILLSLIQLVFFPFSHKIDLVDNTTSHVFFFTKV